jgi:hypothetical protein
MKKTMKKWKLAFYIYTSMDTEVMGFSLTQHCTAHRHPTHVQHTTQCGSPLKEVKIQRKEEITSHHLRIHE